MSSTHEPGITLEQWAGSQYLGLTLLFTVKAIGDSLMMAFRRSSQAVEFATKFGMDTGVDHIGIRVGINSGEVEIRENDIYGPNVNFTSRVQSNLPKEGVLVSNSVKRDYEKTFGTDSDVTFIEREVELRSFGRETLWKVRSRTLRRAIASQRTARAALLGTGKIPLIL